jgi:CRP/FNR family cyclic AMP-dependent transcriptional regulator
MRTSSDEQVESFRDGEIVVREGDLSREMFVIQRGSVEVTKLTDAGEVALATLGRGNFFGEMSLLDSQPRSATVRAKGDTRLLVIEPGSLLIKIRRDPTFAFEMLQHLSARVRELDERLVRLMADHQHAPSDAPPTRPSTLDRYTPSASASLAERRQ